MQETIKNEFINYVYNLGKDKEIEEVLEEIPEGWRKGRTNGNYFGNTKITCDICNNYTSNIGNVSKHKKKCNG